MKGTVYLVWYTIVIFIMNIYPKTLGWTMRHNFNYVHRPQFQTFSRSPTIGPMFLNAKSYLTFLPKNLQVIATPNDDFTPEPFIVTEKTATIFHKVHKRQDDQKQEVESELVEEGKEEAEKNSSYEFNFDYDLEETTSDMFEEIINDNVYDGEQ